MSDRIVHETAQEVPRLVSRDEAVAAGLPRYSTGRPCLRGHIVERYTCNSRCVACGKDAETMQKRAAQSRSYRAADREAYLAKERERNKTRQDRKVHSKAFRESAEGKAYYAAYRASAKSKAYAAEYRAKNQDRHRQLVTAWRKANPESVAAIRGNRRARLGSAEGQHTQADIKFLYIMQDGQCASCTLELSITGHHVDHIIPLARGGSNWPDNLQILCPSCNCSKGTKTMDEWVAARGW